MTDPVARLTEALAKHYEVVQELGEGGMAMVYLANDIRHDRQVAVKVMKPELAASIGTERFLREIQVTAKLSHPHILPLYDSGAADGVLFYVMPFIQGESLADLVDREKQLSIEDAVQYCREVAEGLGYAHSYGLVHRDIKPDNIMLSGGHAIVADFGISRAVTEAAGEKLTQTGMSVGTPAYMSPEQAAGDPNVDGRSDVYSLGCVLYECLIGQVPFTGPTPVAVMARHTMDHVTPPHIMRDTIPEDLEDIILCAMAKSPADRFRTATEMAEALKAVETGGLANVRKTPAYRTAVRRRQPAAWRKAVVPAVALVGAALGGFGVWQLLGNGTGAARAVEGGLDPSRVAVLYFEDLSPGEEYAHVADGLTEGLIDKLSEVRALSVISENGVAPFRGSGITSDSVARALEAGSVIEGSLERVGGDFRVTARLVDGESGADFARAGFRLPADHLLAAQDSVLDAVSRLLRQRLGEEIAVRERRAETSSVEAWGFVQRAERLRKEATSLRRAGESERAGDLLQQADSVLALAEAADTRWNEPTLQRGWIAYDRSRLFRGDQTVPWLEAGIAHADRILARRPRDAKALELRGTLRYRYWTRRVTPDPDAWHRLLTTAQEDLETAVQEDPSLSEAQLTLSNLYYQVDDVPAALLAARRALEEDAYLRNAAGAMNRLFWGSIDLEQFSQARRWCAEGAHRFPTDYRFVDCNLWLMATPAVTADVDRAWRLRATLDSVAPESIIALERVQGNMLVAGSLARAGLADSARSILREARGHVTHEVDPDQSLLTVEAYIRILLGDLDEAIDLVKRYKAANPDHAWAETAGTTWWWRELRAHPRFSEITSSG